MPEEKRQTVRRLEELYARIPKFECRRGCSECCVHPIWSRAEWDRLPESRRENKASLMCQYSCADGKCEVYERRPLTCRLFGSTERLSCPYTGPDKLLTRGEEDAILRSYADILKD